MQKNAFSGWFARGSIRPSTKLLLVMKLTFILLTVAFLHAGATGFSQRVTFTGTRVPLEKVFAAIKEQTGYRIIYNNSTLDGTTPVTLSEKDTPLLEFLNLLLKEQPIKSVIASKTILLTRKPEVQHKQRSASDFITEFSLIKGKVRDEEGNPLAGATIKVKGKSVTAISDIAGNFELTALENDILIVSYVGFKTKEVKIGQEMIEIILEQAKSSLDTTVVMYNAGYYSVKERERTGSIARVDAKTISKQPVNTPMEALIGRMPGVEIVQQTGVPGGSFKVEIRGINSLRYEARDPLYLIDGVPIPANTMQQTGLVLTLGSGTNPLNYINPADIESIEVLKDADATAIYGSRGANGVVLIQTKSAKAGKTGFELNVSSGISKVQKKMDLLNTEEYLMMRMEAFANDGVSPSNTDYDVNGTWDPSRYTDWQKELIGGTATTNNFQGSLNGGNEFTQFAFRANYLRQTTVFPGDFPYQKGSGALNVNHLSSNKKLQANFSVMYGLDHNTQPGQDLSTQVLLLAPNAPALLDEKGDLNWARDKNGSATFPLGFHPYAYMFRKYEALSNTLTTNAYINYNVWKGLSLRSTLGYTSIRLREDFQYPIKSQYLQSYTTGNHFINHNTNNTWIIEPQINYERKIGRGDFTVLVGSTFQANTQFREGISGAGYTSDLLIDNITAAPSKSASSSESEYKYNAVFGRIHYNYEGKYLMNLTGRRDGSSRFGPDRQFANFGAVGAAWIFSQEKGIAAWLPQLSFGKLRGSYGATGSDIIGDYGFISTFTATEIYDGSGLMPTLLANRDYSWETTRKLEFALDLGFLQDKILLSASYYRNRTTGQLVGYPLSDITGFSSVQFNLPATVQNKGIELELRTTNVSNDLFSWRTTAHISIPKNTLLSYPNIEGSIYINTYTVGKSMYRVKGYRYLGVDPQTGMYTFDDVNKNGRMDIADRTVAAKTLTSHWTGGLLNAFTYKNFQLDIFFQMVNKTLRDPSAGLQAPGRMANQHRMVLNRWQQPGDITTIQMFSQRSGVGSPVQQHSYINSSDRLMNGSFLRLKNVSFSWNAPKTWLESMKMNHLRLYLQGQNLYTRTKYIGDPETGSLSTLPPLTTWVAGIQINI